MGDLSGLLRCTLVAIGTKLTCRDVCYWSELEAKADVAKDAQLPLPIQI
jgi:hypothetical protein